ncbi:hypothetical protein MtrunA17_Chr4g0046621 [Medicago truncatula]|uniref:Uncharacterized protein n=1 Tax=Medicago truncatula TaxID=3880 RepID=A0A396IDP0_MEDTR|nr:hypothetical protein MtrunA17_Chr4g0046621 [Medicago truncatula]
MQMPHFEVSSEQVLPFCNGFLSLSSNLNVFGKYKRLFSPALMPIRCPRDTLLSLKNDAITSVSRLEEESEEKLVEGICSDNEYGSTGAAGSDSTTLSLIFRKPRPNGHPLGISSFCEE